jgi:hypothetical protein
MILCHGHQISLLSNWYHLDALIIFFYSVNTLPFHGRRCIVTMPKPGPGPRPNSGGGISTPAVAPCSKTWKTRQPHRKNCCAYTHAQ